MLGIYDTFHNPILTSEEEEWDGLIIPPMSFDTLKEENPALAQRLIVEVGK